MGNTRPFTVVASLCLRKGEGGWFKDGGCLCSHSRSIVDMRCSPIQASTCSGWVSEVNGWGPTCFLGEKRSGWNLFLNGGSVIWTGTSLTLELDRLGQGFAAESPKRRRDWMPRSQPTETVARIWKGKGDVHPSLGVPQRERSGILARLTTFGMKPGSGNQASRVHRRNVCMYIHTLGLDTHYVHTVHTPQLSPCAVSGLCSSAHYCGSNVQSVLCSRAENRPRLTHCINAGNDPMCR